MPIKARIDMLTTGIRTPVGIKIYGADITARSSGSGTAIERACRGPRARAASSPSGPPAASSSTSIWKRDELARYGLSIDDAQMVVMSAIGGDTVTTTVEGRERYPVNVRYFRDYRSDLDQLQQRDGAGHGRPHADPDRPARRRERWSADRRCCATKTAC